LLVDVETYQEFMNVPIEGISKKKLEINYNNEFWRSLNFDIFEDIMKNLNYEFSLKNLREQYFLLTDKKLSLFTIRKILKSHFSLNYGLLRNSSKAFKYQAHYEEKYIYMKLFIKMMMNGYHIIFTDELPFDAKTRRRKMWRNNKDYNFLRKINYVKKVLSTLF